MELTVEALIQNVDEVTDFINEQLEEMGCSMRIQTQVDIAIDELFSNICRYAYGEGVGHAKVSVNELPGQNAVQITLEDSGIPFDPLAKEDPDVTLSLHERNVGGLGIFMVKKIMNDIQYEYRDGVNVLTITKKL